MSIQFGNRLAQLRKQNGYSQESLAEKLGLSRQAISKWERGESTPDTDTLIMLAKLYGVSLDELVGHTPSAPRTAAPEKPAEPTEPKPTEKKKEKKPALHPGLTRKMLLFPFPLVIAALYSFIGLTFRLWHPTWLLFLLIPIYYALAFAAAAPTKKQFYLRQPAILYAVILFLLLGLLLNAWKWAWILFILALLYYWFVGTQWKDKEKPEK